jgi:hypothetical protein
VQFRFWVAITAAGLLVSCATYRPQLPGAIASGTHEYINDVAGIRIAFPDQWDISTGPASGPKEFRPLFRTLQSPTTELLFIGMDSSKSAFVRCVAEAFDGGLDSYYTAVVRSSGAGINPLAADFYEGKGRKLVVWTYDIGSGAQASAFEEYIIDLGGTKCRLSFWTSPDLFSSFHAEFEKTAKTVCTGKELATCEQVWAAKDSAEAHRTLK